MVTATKLLAALPQHFESIATTHAAADRAHEIVAKLSALAEQERGSPVRKGNSALQQ